MLLSFRELIVWIGVGPFEVALHSLGLLVFTLLLAIRVEGHLPTATWHSVFIPLYVTLALHAYFSLVLFVRMMAFVVKKISGKSRKCRRLSVPLYIVVCNTVGLGLTLFVEYSIASYLDEQNLGPNLIIASTLFLVYLLARFILVYRTLKEKHS